MGWIRIITIQTRQTYTNGCQPSNVLDKSVHSQKLTTKENQIFGTIAADNSACGSSLHSIAGCANPFDQIKSGLKAFRQRFEDRSTVVCAKP